MLNNMQDDISNHKTAWRQVKHAERFRYAFHGLYVFWKTTKHISFHLLAAVVAIVLGFYFHISNVEWFAIIFSIGFVLVAEAFNTAIEIDIDLTSPDYHPYARDTKDVAAGAVLLASLTALAIGLIIFIPKIL